jgi:hypothetical protein
MRNLTLFALVLVSVTACRNTDGDDGVTPDSSINTDDVKIQDIQNDAMPNGTAVKVKGVVVTAVDNYGGKKGDFWVEEPEGGPFSGVHVYGGPLEQVAALKVGDVVDITGAVKDDFHYNGTNGVGGFEEGYAITELKPVEGGQMAVTKTGATMTIEPDVVDALAIGQMTDYMARDAEWEKWEGVLITVKNVAAMSTDKCVGSQCPDTTNHSFEITGDVLVQSSLGPMPTPTVSRGDCLGSVTGVVDYFFDYQILPRDTDGDGTTEDLGLTGGTCPLENSPALCGDTIDNDGNGFNDCNDNACVVGAASCRQDDNATIAGIQAGTVAVNSNVRVQSGVVMAVSFSKRDVWISTTKDAAVSNGIQVHFNDPVPGSIAVGKTVEVIGKVIEFNDSMNVGTGTLTEITGYAITASNAATQTPAALAATAATLNDDTTGEPYESVLVTLTNVKITTAADSTNHVGSMTQGSIVFKFDDAIHRLSQEGAVNTCFPSIKGVWSYNAFDNNWVFYPAGATTTGSGC